MDSEIKSYKDLKIWQLATELIIKVYRLFNAFPREEKFGIVSQGKDSIVSVAANIAESFGRYHFKDRLKFIYNSRGSLLETESHLIISEKLGFIKTNNKSLYLEILNDIKSLGIKINNYISSLSRNIRKQ